MGEPFPVLFQDGMTRIPRPVDDAFRHALTHGCPDQVRPKIKEALAAIPGTGAAARSRRYFGPELPALLKRVAPLIDELEVFLDTSKNMPGFKRWLELTGFANDYRMIKAMVYWADHVYDREGAEIKSKQDTLLGGIETALNSVGYVKSV